ncbi:hypothetical protein [Candidatus Foliamicus sp.]
MLQDQTQAFTDVSTVVPNVDPDAQELVQKLQSDPRFRGYRWREEATKDLTTSLTGLEGDFSPSQSSAVFSSDGPERISLAYAARIGALRHAAEQDGYSLNPASENYFWRFVKSKPQFRRGNVVLMDNGNLRVVWKDGQGTHLGLQFLDSEMVQYVIFKRRSREQQISRVAGRDNFEGVRRQIRAFNLDSLLSE